MCLLGWFAVCDYGISSCLYSLLLIIVSEYDQEIPQSHTADKPKDRYEEPHNNQETLGRQTKQSNQLSLSLSLSLPHQDDCKTRMDIKT